MGPQRTTVRPGRFRLTPLALVMLLLLAGPAAASSSPAFAAAAEAVAPPRAPNQPGAGPGGTDYRFARTEARRVGEPPLGYWLFSPADDTVGDPPEAGTELPVVLFLHGVTALDPRVYQGWIDHIVRRGAFVVYPDYHPANALSVPWSTFLPNLRESVASAETALAGDGSLRPDWSRFAVVGHSLGGVLTTAYAAVAATDGALPVPAALMVVQPGGCRGCGGLTDEGGVPMPDLGTVDPSTRLLVVTADEDEVVGERAARLIWAGLGALPAENKAFVRLRSDRRGQPPLLANHLLAQTGGPGATTDALDWYGTFRLFDLLTACAFAERDCAATLDGPTHELGMGRWSDGTAVTTALVGDDPAALAPPGPLVDG